LLWRTTQEPVLCFDGDKAGVRAAWRSLDLALPGLKPGRSVRYALLPEGKDPDDLVNQGGREAFDAVLNAAKPLADMLWSRETSGGSSTRRNGAPISKSTCARRPARSRMKACAATTARRCASASTPISARRNRAEIGNKPTGRLRVAAAGARRHGRRPAGDLRKPDAVAPAVAAVDEMPLREAALVSTVLCHPDLLADHFDDFTASISIIPVWKNCAAPFSMPAPAAGRAAARRCLNIRRSVPDGDGRSPRRADPPRPPVDWHGRGGRTRTRWKDFARRCTCTVAPARCAGNCAPPRPRSAGRERFQLRPARRHPKEIDRDRDRWRRLSRGSASPRAARPQLLTGFGATYRFFAESDPQVLTQGRIAGIKDYSGGVRILSVGKPFLSVLRVGLARTRLNRGNRQLRCFA
jgi:hypothetical protein